MEPNENLTLTDKDIFTKIWTSPKQVFKYINDNHYDKYVIVLLVLAGITRAFERAISKNSGEFNSLGHILASSILLGGLLGWISYYIYAVLISLSGKYLNGQGNTKSILRVMSYALIPSLIGLVLIFLHIGFFGIEVFQKVDESTSMGLQSNLFIYGFMILQAVLAIWTLVFLVVGISEVQKLSYGKSFLNIILPFLIFVIAFTIVSILSGGFSWLKHIL